MSSTLFQSVLFKTPSFEISGVILILQTIKNKIPSDYEKSTVYNEGLEAVA